MVFLRLLRESVLFATHALVVNKLRTFLSLLGVAIGIFSIIAVLTFVDSLENNIRSSINKLGSDVIYIQKWPWGGDGGEYAWWEYWKRPQPKYREYEQLKDRIQNASAVAYGAGTGENVKYSNKTLQNVTLLAVSHSYNDIWGFELSEGRMFTTSESAGGSNVAIIGYDVAESLFGTTNPLGKEIKTMGRKLTIIGVFKKVGSSLIGQSTDEQIIIPVNFLQKIVNVGTEEYGPFIMVKAKEGISPMQIKDEITGIMRKIRRLKPKANDDFSMNEISVMSEGIGAVFGVVNLAGVVIGGFSLLVGGFGIANIMFVSVKERTNQIGIQKSLGAKNQFILLQFIFESIILSLVGGGAGLLIVFLLTLIFKDAVPGFEITLSYGNVLWAFIVSFIIGVVSGIIPALMASRLNPVDAIRQGQ